MVELTYQMVLSTLQTAGLLVGIAYYVLSLNYTKKNQEISLRNQEEALKTRNATLANQILGPMLSTEGTDKMILLQRTQISSYEEWQELCTNTEYLNAMNFLCTIYENIGVNLRERTIDIEFVAQLNPYFQLRFWRQYKPIILEHRKKVYPGYFRNMEYFMELLEKYCEEHPELLTP